MRRGADRESVKREEWVAIKNKRKKKKKNTAFIIQFLFILLQI